jgi:hypothetical protein
MCTPPGQEEFFVAVGTPVTSRTEPPPPLDQDAQAAFIAKSKALAPAYRTELIREAVFDEVAPTVLRAMDKARRPRRRRNVEKLIDRRRERSPSELGADLVDQGLVQR